MEHIDYLKQAQDFLDKTQTTFKVEYLKTGKYFDDDKSERDIYNITLKRGDRSYTFTFGQSISHSGKYWMYGKSEQGISRKLIYPFSDWDINKNFSEPTPYDVLAAVQKYDPGTFENFCGDFGYDTDSIKANKTYHAVIDEYQHLAMLYNDAELTELAEIP
jgi:hypothetical protein